MPHIFINGLNAKSGGGKSILTNFLSLASKSKGGWHYYLLVPKVADYQDYSGDNISLLELPQVYTKTLMFPLVNRWVLPKLVRKLKCDLIFNLANAPMPIDIKQAFLFQWPYAVYPESPIWKIMDFKSWLIRKAKLYYFKKYLPHVDLMIAQTPVMKGRLEKLFDLRDVEVVSNAVSLDNLISETTHDFQLGDGLNLLYLTYYYPHKNLEIFLPLAREIKARKEKIRIITTIAAEQAAKAAKFLREVERQNLQDVIHNIGPVAMKDVPSLYQQTDGLLMPTLLETFGIPYTEAMSCSKSIFTSDLDFARDVCHDAAYYFDPFDADQILDKILESQSDPQGKRRRIEAGKKVLDELLTWEQAFDAYMCLFDKLLEDAN
ncbi:MAG: glycosyltransferase [Hyphomicrobiales bacterium]|nr:glycosyltransferase [Hyphomicrobiales bacterium]